MLEVGEDKKRSSLGEPQQGETALAAGNTGVTTHLCRQAVSHHLHRI